MEQRRQTVELRAVLRLLQSPGSMANESSQLRVRRVAVTTLLGFISRCPSRAPCTHRQGF